MSLFDAHSRPLPRFYELTVSRRAEAIQEERVAVYLRRHRLSRSAFFRECMTYSTLHDSVGALDLLSPEMSTKRYQSILMGENYGTA